jgi:L-idonate 5-dehydrogenase
MKTDTDHACVIHGAHDVRVEEVERQPIGADDVEVAIAVGGICGSDLSYFLKGAVGDFRVRQPMVLGHEVVGTVTQVGSNVGYQMVGQRVVINPSRPCLACAMCRVGSTNICLHGTFLGSAAPFPHVQGAFRERMVIAASQVVPLPPSLPFGTAVFAEPLAVATHALHRCGDLQGRSVIVIGGGPIGGLLTLVVRHRGCASVTVADLHDEPLRRAQRAGATHTVNLSAVDAALGPGEIVFEASGTPGGLATALRCAAPGGTVVLVGLLPGTEFAVPAQLIVPKELSVHGSYRFTASEFLEAVTMLSEGLDAAALVTARIEIGSASAAFALAADRIASGKVQLVLGDR